MRTFSGLFLAMLSLAAVAAAQDLVPADGSCWQKFAPRAQNAPEATMTREAGNYSLRLASGDKTYVYGGWRCRIEGIQGGAHYRFRASALPRNIANTREALGINLRWRGDFGGAVAPAFLWQPKTAGGALEFDRVVEAPAKTKAVEIELVLQWTPSAEVGWRGISLTPAAAPAPRKIRVASVWLRPRNSKSGSESVERFAEYIDRIAPEQKPDIVVLGEMINHVGARGTFDEKAEPIPGPTTERIGEQARKYKTWIAFSMVEREGRDLFNAGVLIDRNGRIVGKYRKVQLPFEEVSQGISPGSGFPVFDTEFGKIGMMICHDASFPEAARQLALNGAEMILMPIWGGRQPLVHARAIENGIYVVSSGYDYDSEIVDPLGRVLSKAPRTDGGTVAVADIDLSARFRQDWVGDWFDSYRKQQRPAAYR